MLVYSTHSQAHPWELLPPFPVSSYPLFRAQFQGGLPLRFILNLDKWHTLQKIVPSGHCFLPSLIYKQPCKCSLPKTNKQTKKLPTILYFCLQDRNGKLKQWHLPVILYKMCKDKIKRNELKPQKIVRWAEGKYFLWSLLNTGAGLQRERLRDSS